ncbi:MAG TPA: N-glycosylase/DNA lyase [Candidatus Sumerlaeia bacterium]|mgnify:FL=1|nr:MAG: putative N-glycosylase/DNA lyase [candidate division BRC1 bacterium ADurb.Bin183]HRR30635.1 N-glycosylase/DNA lyase [Candidatus Sumerlaeia bacterium]
MRLKKLLRLYERIRPQIEERLAEFRAIGEQKKPDELFAELAFCLLTPQSNAHQCWTALECLRERHLLFNGEASEIAPHLAGRARFHRTKSRNICAARANLSALIERLSAPPNELRRWLVENIRGIGWKEASHFLRNIGLGGDLAILDRHILRQLAAFGVIPAVPRSMSASQYLQIEERMREWAACVNIPIAHLDLLFWYQTKGELFK